MKRIIAGALVAFALALAVPVQAHIIEVTSFVSLDDLQDLSQLSAALAEAVNGVLENAIAFTPTVVTVTRAQVIGERLYFRLLIVDEEGEKMLGDLGPEEGAERPGEPVPVTRETDLRT